MSNERGEAGANGQGGGKAILHDSLYYRSDGEIIDDIALRGGFSCRVFLGLRRFGKSSFLARIERWCNGVNNGWDVEKIRPDYREKGVRAYFVECMNPESIGNAITTGLNDQSDGVKTKIFLLDDIQGYAAPYNRGDDTSDADAALRDVFREARKRPAEIRIVLAEPTNHLEWLDTEPAGQWLDKRCGDGLRFVHAPILALSRDQSAALLTGSPPDKMGKTERKHDLSDQQIDRLHSAFGGNPWLLGYAYRKIDARGDLAILSGREIESFITEVNTTIDPGSLRSIYNSLASEEKLIVDLLADLWITKRDPERLEIARRDHRESLTLFERGEEDVWHEKASRYHVSLGEVGLASVDKVKNIARDLTSEAFASFVHKSIRKGKPILDEPESIENWSELISGPSPADRLRGRCVIHQFSDLLFDSPSGHAYWQKYLKWIGKLKAVNDERTPHFIIICGNILPGELESDTLGYRKHLQEALNSLHGAVTYLKPVEGSRMASPSQIIIVPGVLDIDWPAANEVPHAKRAEELGQFYERQKVWDEEIVRCGFSVAETEDVTPDPKGPTYSVPKPILFMKQRVAFILFDSADIAGVKEELGNEAAYDIIDIRRRIRIKFQKDWLRLRDDAPPPKGKKNVQRDKVEGWTKFLGSTWRYAFSVDDAEARDANVPDENIETPTFRWAEYRSSGAGKAVEEEWVSEAGFVTRAARAQLGATIGKLSDDSMMKIAVMHHAPRQLRRSTLVAFYQSYRLRQALTQAGVRWILHGNSILQQRVDEAVAHSGSRPLGGTDRSREMSLLSSGPFSDMVDYLPEGFLIDSEGEVLGRPSFNEITITPPDRDDPDRKSDRDEAKKKKGFSVSVSFLEWPSKDAAEPIQTR